MMDRKIGHALIRQCGWLAATPEHFQDEVLKRAGFYSIEKGKWIYHPGDTGDGLWGVVDGGVHVLFTQGSLGARTGIYASTGFWVGEGSLLTREARMVGLRTTRDSKLLHLPSKAFFAIAAEQPEAWRWVGLLTYYHMVGALGLREDLCIREPATRVIATLIRMMTPQWGGPAINGELENIEVTIDINQSELADLCNVSRSLLAGLLSELRSEGTIEPGYAMIRILNPAKLQQRLNQCV